MRTLSILFLFTITVSATSFASNGKKHGAQPAVEETDRTGQVKTVLILDRIRGIEPLKINYSLPAAAVAEPFESSPSSPPLNTDDPGTPGTRGIEVNFVTECESVSDESFCQSGIDAAFGIGEKTQLRISKYEVREKSAGAPAVFGSGQTSVGVKHRFYDRDGLQLGIFPSYQFNDATRRTNDDGTPAETEGRSIYLPIIVSKDLGKWTLVSNTGYTNNLDHPDANSVYVSLAAGRGLSATSRVMGEVTGLGSSAGFRSDVRVGWLKILFPNEKSRYSTAIFTSVGRSIKSEDGRTHVTVRVGLQVALKPKILPRPAP